LHGFGDGGGADGREHDFLEGHGVARVHAAVQDVEEGDGKDIRGFDGAGFEAEEFVKGDVLSRVST